MSLTTLLHLLILLSISLDLGSSENGGVCYYPDGENSFVYHACDPDADVSMCCSDVKQCLSNGLCAVEDSSDSGILFARGTCTDQTWRSEICPQYCRVNPDFPANASAIDFGNNGVQVWNCGPSQGYGSPAGYCCDSGGQSTECCSTPSAVFHLDAATLGNPSSTTATTTATTSSTTASSSTGSSTTPLLISTPSPAVPTSTATISSMPTSSLSGLSNGAKAGIGVGVVLGVILSAGLVFGLWKMSRIAKSRKELHARPPATAATALPIIELDSVKPLRYELGEEGFYDRKGELVSELEASHGRSEMLS